MILRLYIVVCDCVLVVIVLIDVLKVFVKISRGEFFVLDLSDDIEVEIF